MKKSVLAIGLAISMLSSTSALALDGGAPAWLVIGLYEGTIPISAISEMGYGDFDWANMSPAERLSLYNAAQREVSEDQ